MEMAHIGSGHMYTYVSPVFICGKVDDAARKAVENCRIYKHSAFHSMAGWNFTQAAWIWKSVRSILIKADDAWKRT